MTDTYLYILQDPDKTSKCKVGITVNLNQRLKAYRTACPQCVFMYTTVIDSKRREKEVLSLLKDTINVDREYVHCNAEFVKRIIEGYLQDVKSWDG